MRMISGTWDIHALKPYGHVISGTFTDVCHCKKYGKKRIQHWNLSSLKPRLLSTEVDHVVLQVDLSNLSF